MAGGAGRGGNKTWNCFICGREGHFAIVCPEKNKLMVPADEPKVNLISLGDRVYAITRSKEADERLNNREEHKEAEQTKDTDKKISRNQWAEEIKLAVGITKIFSRGNRSAPQPENSSVKGEEY